MQNKGFSVLEMLLVLFIVSNVLLMSFDNSIILDENLDNEVSLFKSKYDLFRLQVYSEEKCNVLFTNNSYSFSCLDFFEEYILPEGLTINNNFKNDMLIFADTGNIRTAGSVVFSERDNELKLSFSILSGSINEQ